jgi:CheY-like chemotaxis protein
MGSIVIVDDEGVLLDSLARVLQREFSTLSVKSTQDPRQARHWIEEEKPAVLITDVRMPEVSGLDLLSTASQRWGNVPVILMTAYASPEVDALVQLGTFKYLPKPFHNHQLIKLVQEMLTPMRVGFDGSIAVSMLADVIQLHALAGSSGILYVDSENGGGSIWFSVGRIVHAATMKAKAEDAFYEIMKWQGGRFSFAAQSVKEKTIRMSSSELLMEGYRRRDEDLNSSARPMATEARATSPPEVNLDDPVELIFDLIEDDIEYSVTVEEKPKAEETLQAEEPPQAEEKPISTILLEDTNMANNIKESLSKLEGIDGFLGACIADSDSGMCLGTSGGSSGFNLEVAGASNAEVVKSKRKAIKNLNLRDEIEDILITLGKHYHLIRPTKSKPAVFFYLVLERSRANLALARMSLNDIEKDLVL